MGAELVVRLLDLGPELGAASSSLYRLSANPSLRYELVPGAKLPSVQINEAGMRCRSYAIDKSPTVFRIVCIGDSLAFGYGAAQSQSFPALLEHYLGEYIAREPGRFEVLNFGVTGYNAAQAVESLRTKALAYDPDLVVYTYCLNDPQEYSLEFEELRLCLGPAERGYYDRLIASGDRWARRFRLYLLWRYWLERRSSASGEDDASPDPEPTWVHLRRGTHVDYFTALHERSSPWQRVLGAFDALESIARENEIKACVVVFPVFADLAAYELAAVHGKVAQAATARSLEVVDLLGHFQSLARTGSERFAHDEMHPNARGYSEAAGYTLRCLVERGVIPAAHAGAGGARHDAGGPR
jgi:lysophospholipase L1-like esterase